ncbi:MAG TPA: AAA-associated domain-containing protein [Thermoplasmata archaeon]|nr:AAA-associated domain-containing protein [Thermoplasmata archaeon]
MPTVYPKAAPTEMMGLLILLNDHKGAEDVARLADDLDLEIDEILPSLEFAAALQLVSVSDGRATLTDTGRKLLAGSIRERKTLLREQLKRTTLFRTLLTALENAPEHRLTDEEVNRLIEFTSAPADALVQNIINWGRYAELFRYDSDAHVLLPSRARAGGKSAGGSRLPPSPPDAPPEEASSDAPAGSSRTGVPSERLRSLAGVAP